MGMRETKLKIQRIEISKKKVGNENQDLKATVKGLKESLKLIERKE